MSLNKIEELEIRIQMIESILNIKNNKDNSTYFEWLKEQKQKKRDALGRFISVKNKI